MWSLAVEVAFYVVLPLLAYLLLVVLCRRRWRPGPLLIGLACLAALTPAWLVLVHTTDFLPDGAKLWLPTYLAWFIGGMMLAALQAMGVRAYAMACIPLAVACYFIVSTPIAGEPTTSPAELREALAKAGFYAVIATLAVAPLALGDSGLYARFLASRPMVFLGEISYEIFLIHLLTMELVMVEILQLPDLYGFDGDSVRGHVRGDGPARVAAAPLHSRALAVGGRRGPPARCRKSSARTTRSRVSPLRRKPIGWPDGHARRLRRSRPGRV